MDNNRQRSKKDETRPMNVDDDDGIYLDSDIDELGQSRQWDCSLGRKAVRTYRESDFRPTVKDPLSKFDGHLAAFYPVYVGNFQGPKGRVTDSVFAKCVHRYFAGKGLPSFLVFRYKDLFFYEHQELLGLYDFLVYFCTRMDAKRAILWCNRETYQGHKLNVLCGRTQALFTVGRSYSLTMLLPKYQHEPERSMEEYCSRHGDVKCVVKHELTRGFVEFESVLDLFEGDSTIEVKMVKEPTARQRFVEDDVLTALQQLLQNKPKLIRCRPPKDLLRTIKHGVIPKIVAGCDVPSAGPKPVQKRKRNRRHRNRNRNDNFNRNQNDNFNRNQNDNFNRNRNAPNALDENAELDKRSRKGNAKGGGGRDNRRPPRPYSPRPWLPRPY